MDFSFNKDMENINPIACSDLIARTSSNLKKCSLFKHLNVHDIINTLSFIEYTINDYVADEYIAFEEDHLSNIGIILSGTICIQKIYPSGKTINLTTMNTGDIFGEVIVFSDTKNYPATIVSSSNSEIMFISKSNILKLCKSNIYFLENLMNLLSNKVLLLNKKLTLLSHNTIKEKISSFLVSEYQKQNTLTIKLYSSKKHISEQMGITRPSFSRELIKMKEEGLIDYDKKTITIKNLLYIENILI